LAAVGRPRRLLCGAVAPPLKPGLPFQRGA
jgi:hypothetical protein